MQRHQKVLKYVLARKHSRWEESFKKLKHALHKDEKIEARFSPDLDKIRVLKGTMNSITPKSKVLRQYHSFQKKHDKDSVMQLYKDFRQQQQRQKAEDDKRLREDLFRDLHHIIEEAERKK